MRLLRRMRAGLTKHYRIIRVGACTLASTLACTSDPFAKGDATIKYDPEAVTSVAAPSGFPTDGCLQNVSQFASIRESESIVPEGVRSKPAQQDIGWQPWELADIEAGKDRYAVVDRRAASATLFSSDLKRRIHWERKGNGPGELQNPVFVRFDPRGDSIWVFDSGRRKIIGFDLNGNFGREIDATGNVASFDITEDGRFFVSHVVIVANATNMVTVVSEVLPNGQSLPMVSTEASNLGPPEFILRGPNRPQIKMLGDRAGLIFPAAGMIVLYQPGPTGFRRIRSIATCMPTEVANAYAEQLESGLNRQSYLVLIEDVVRHGDTLLTVNSSRDVEGRYGIQRFDINTGANLGSIAIPSGPINVPPDVRFQRDVGIDLVAMDPRQGFIVNLSVSLQR